MTKSNIKWRLNSFHLIIILTMPLLVGIVSFSMNVVISYFIMSLIPYIIIAIIMTTPNVSFLLRIFFITIGWILYINFNPIVASNEFDFYLKDYVPISSLLNYTLFIWAGYPRFTQILPSTKILLLILAQLLSPLVLLLVSVIVMLFKYLSLLFG